MSERKISEDVVREEHLSAVNVGAHWAYLVGVLVGANLLMLGLIAFLGTTV